MQGQTSNKGARLGIVAAIALLSVVLTVRADELIPVLKVGSEVYSNVTVTSVTATDIYFSHARGIGNVKLKNLDPDLQRHFKYDAARAAVVEKQQLQANAQFRSNMVAEAAAAAVPHLQIDEDGNVIPPKLYAQSFLGRRPPQIIVDQWLTPPPMVDGKFVLVEFWTTWAEPCRKAISHLNELQAKFKDQLVVIGLSNENEEDIRKMTSPHMDYSVGTDTQARTWNMLGIQGIPHAILIDPQNTVRFEGQPDYLTEKGLTNLIARYSN
jgi:thiol-disulfide isomerase/thioredoxin